jgi:hypothetical protein
MGYLVQIRNGQNSTKDKAKQSPKGRGRKHAQSSPPAPPCTVDEAALSRVKDDSDAFHLCFQVMSVNAFINSLDTTGKVPFPTLSG